MAAAKKKQVKKTEKARSAQTDKPGKAKPKTSESPANPPGRGGQVLPQTPKPFSSTNQPSPEAKKKGWAKRRILKDLLDFSASGTFSNSKVNYPKLVADYFGIDVADVTVRMIMDYRQIEKAVLKADTTAYVAVCDRADGKPKQKVELIPDTTIYINGKKVATKSN